MCVPTAAAAAYTPPRSIAQRARDSADSTRMKNTREKRRAAAGGGWWCARFSLARFLCRRGAWGWRTHVHTQLRALWRAFAKRGRESQSARARKRPQRHQYFTFEHLLSVCSRRCRHRRQALSEHERAHWIGRFSFQSFQNIYLFMWNLGVRRIWCSFLSWDAIFFSLFELQSSKHNILKIWD